MHSESDPESESSLPIHPRQIFPSSPPAIEKRKASFDESQKMDTQPHFKSEPPATQNEEASKPPPRRVSSEETERPPSAQQMQRDDEVTDENDEENDDDEEQEIDSDPAEVIVDFDWDELHRQYHDAMKHCHSEEGELAAEWESLMSYFRIWAESGHDHETDRTFQRLKTRTAYVQNAEAKLDQKRNHYVSVVKAFESALNLLKAQGYGR